jgi:hypothetical protein
VGPRPSFCCLALLLLALLLLALLLLALLLLALHTHELNLIGLKTH